MNINGIGGIFLKAQNPDKLCEWYEKYFGLCRSERNSFIVPVEKLCPNYQLLIFLQHESTSNPSAKVCMLNFQVSELQETLSQLASAGTPIDDNVQETEKGLFAWVYDPEGNRIELYQPRSRDYTLINEPEAE